MFPCSDFPVITNNNSKKLLHLILTGKRISENIDDKLTFVNEAFRLCCIKFKEKETKSQNKW